MTVGGGGARSVYGAALFEESKLAAVGFDVSDVKGVSIWNRTLVKHALTEVMEEIASKCDETMKIISHDMEGSTYFMTLLKQGSKKVIVMADSSYPLRVVMNIAKELFTHTKVTNAIIEATITTFKDPAKVDKIVRLQEDLTELKVVLGQTVDLLLERQTRLDALVASTEQLNIQSAAFYKEAKKTNKCCQIM